MYRIAKQAMEAGAILLFSLFIFCGRIQVRKLINLPETADRQTQTDRQEAAASTQADIQIRQTDKEAERQKDIQKQELRS